MPDCLFCKIVKKEIPAFLVHEDAATLGFLDVHPRAPGHILVIPKAHRADIIELETSEVGPLFLAVRKLVRAAATALAADGFTIGVNHGAVSGQEVSHLHVHIMPRFAGDGGGSVQSVVGHPSEEPLASIR